MEMAYTWLPRVEGTTWEVSNRYGNVVAYLMKTVHGEWKCSLVHGEKKFLLLRAKDLASAQSEVFSRLKTLYQELLADLS